MKGGLGNQLFQLSKALEVSSEFSRVEILNDSLNHETKREFHLSQICARAEFQFFILSKLNTLDSLRVSLAHRSTALPKVICRIVKSVLGVVFDDDLTKVFPKLNIFTSTIFDGYWQKNAKTHVIEGVLENIFAADDFITLERINHGIEGSRGSIIHVRGQDYYKNAKNFENFGILSPKYYQDAIQSCTDDFQLSDFIVVTDDSPLAEYIFPEIPTDRVLTPENLDALQTLKFMSQAECLIIGNSTLAWWAASLAIRTKSKVVIPGAWRRDGKQSIPPRIINSTEVPSVWLEVKPETRIS